jgi:hypothetical protein
VYLTQEKAAVIRNQNNKAAACKPLLCRDGLRSSNIEPTAVSGIVSVSKRATGSNLQPAPGSCGFSKRASVSNLKPAPGIWFSSKQATSNLKPVPAVYPPANVVRSSIAAGGAFLDSHADLLSSATGTDEAFEMFLKEKVSNDGDTAADITTSHGPIEFLRDPSEATHTAEQNVFVDETVAEVLSLPIPHQRSTHALEMKIMLKSSLISSCRGGRLQ